MLPRTQPRTLADLALQVSVVRPGPIVGGAANPYVRRRERQRRDPRFVPVVPHECVRAALEETLGVVPFYGQVLMVARDMGGFTTGEADQFRRAMSRRRSREVMAGYHGRFLAGAARIEAERDRDGAVPLALRLRAADGVLGGGDDEPDPGGAFDALSLNRRELTWQLGLFAGGFARAELRRERDRQLRMPLPTAQDEVSLADFNGIERMGADYALLRL